MRLSGRDHTDAIALFGMNDHDRGLSFGQNDFSEGQKTHFSVTESVI
jgi:hypothetical protein